MSTTLILVLTAVLIGLLALRELLSGIEQPRVQRARRWIQLAVIPLTLVCVGGLVSQVSAISREVTMVVVPTEVPRRPTRTPAPSAVPTREPVQEVFVEERFTGGSGSWPLRARGTWRAAVVDDAYQLRLAGQPEIGISTGLPPGDYTLQLDVTVQAGAAGVVFLAEEPAIFYRLIFNGQGAYQIERVDQNAKTTETLSAWMTSPSIMGANQRNTLRVEREDNAIQFRVNGQALTTFRVPDRPVVNRYGFTVVAADGTGSALFDNVVVQRLAAAAR